eukprot:CAMPEP_0181211176 /NCGR_PEP_ID=MMETSP1096-20121128/23639_1 /TAXON_ID=156174 ORGANISM="Chrysochromulina ericina, Strain CCMP281" /NCGR_SAMPLE_ID=MMETSP1096 /ASSEMBLY_ACC=CAM_ASM_000453 /LENGTH=170 /DNA_ID=CAMNT_0023302545 /DNA_START=247 /DNA_END=756 /DNA_ORIENTATION=+
MAETVEVLGLRQLRPLRHDRHVVQCPRDAKLIAPHSGVDLADVCGCCNAISRCDGRLLYRLPREVHDIDIARYLAAHPIEDELGRVELHGVADQVAAHLVVLCLHAGDLQHAHLLAAQVAATEETYLVLGGGDEVKELPVDGGEQGRECFPVWVGFLVDPRICQIELELC